MNRTVFALTLLLSLVACKKHLPEETLTTATPPPAPVAEAPKPLPQPVATLKANFERVYFGFDSAELDSGSRAALIANADILRKNPEIQIEVQGHADDRGTTDYNLSLGAKRAAAVQSFLAASGVPKSRVATISYGEERPLDASGGEVAWAKNRRAEFRITAGEALADGTTR